MSTVFQFHATKAGLLALLCAFIMTHQRKAIPYAIDMKVLYIWSTLCQYYVYIRTYRLRSGT